MKQHEENRACGLQITILLSVVSRQKLASADCLGFVTDWPAHESDGYNGSAVNGS
jgi:hypothetical protein